MIPTGWVLVEGRFEPHRTMGFVSLKVSSESTRERFQKVELPVLRSDRIHEIVYLPSDTKRIDWEHDGKVACPADGFLLKPIGRCERVLRMLQRILAIHERLSVRERSMLGLSFFSVLFHIAETYRKLTSLRLPVPYAQWVDAVAAISEKDRQDIQKAIEHFTAQPRFKIVVHLNNSRRNDLEETFHSLQKQIYRFFSVTVLADSFGRHEKRVVQEAANKYAMDGVGIFLRHELRAEILRSSSGNEWIVNLDEGEKLEEHALYWLAFVILTAPDATVIYSDDDIVSADGRRHTPRFKPDWSPELLRSTNYIGNAVAFRLTEFRSSGALDACSAGAGAHALILRMTDTVSSQQIQHVPAVLFHRRADTVDADGKVAVEEHLKRHGANVAALEHRPGCYRIVYPLPERSPHVSIIIPTKDSPELLERCLTSVMKKSTYKNFEVIILDNESSDEAALSFMRAAQVRWSVRVVPYNRAFNFSVMINLGAKHAQGEVLCLLNNDTEVITREWLEEMLGHLLQRDVGVVGAKLYYPDGRVQHAGTFVGPGGCANHAHVMLDRDDPGYCNRAALAQDMSAVTAACMITWKDLFLRLGGLNEADLPVAFSDVDYCLQVRKSGKRVIFTPHAELYHHESASRGRFRNLRSRRRMRREVRYMVRKWGDVMEHDPFYNPNLNYQRSDFSLGRLARVPKPWQQERR